MIEDNNLLAPALKYTNAKESFFLASAHVCSLCDAKAGNILSFLDFCKNFVTIYVCLFVQKWKSKTRSKRSSQNKMRRKIRRMKKKWTEK